MGDNYEVILDGGGPWGIRLQGGKDFGVPLNIARVTPGSKAGNKQLAAGDQILQINGQNTETLTHMEAQNLIKNAGSRLQLFLKRGKGASLGDIKQVGGGAMQAAPSKTLYQTDVTHSAHVDHKFNSKPKAFGASPSGPQSASAKKFDPAEYARKKKEELEKYKEDQKKPAVPDSDVLKMLQNTNISGNQPGNTGSFSRLENQLQNEGQWPAEEKAFRMTAEGTDLIDVSPGSREIMDDIKNRGASGLSNTGSASGSRSFKYLQQLTDQEEDLPPPPPELMGTQETSYQRPSFGNTGGNNQSGTFKMLQSHLDSGTGDQVKTVFSQPPGQRNQAVPAAPRVTVQKQPNTATPTPKAPMPTGPNFKVGRPSAPTFKPNPAAADTGSRVLPPAVNAGEIQNPNSRQYNPGYGSPPSAPSHPPSGGGGYSSPPPSAGTANTVMTKGSPQPVPAQGNNKDLNCHACHQPLTGPFVSAIGKTWHPEHFCCSACNTSLQNQAFVEENNQLFCEKCYNQYYAPKCAHCNNAIIGNCINALGKSWHPDHFVCSFCSRNFGSDGFLVDSGKPYCEKCFEDLFSVKCGKCSRPITGGEKYVEALGKNWHSDCFTCTKCNCRLEGNSFFVSNGMPYCQNHKSGN